MTRRLRMPAALAAAVLAVLLFSVDADATRFGRNKVQYGSFTWNITRTQHFDIYFYEGSEDLVDAVSRIAEKANDDYERVLGHKLSTIIPVIVYASHNDFQQTNVTDENLSEGVGGFTELFKNRVVIPFTGSYEELRHVLYHELTHVFMFDIVYGGLVESVIRQAYTNPVPLWFTEGLAEYVSNGWDSEAEMILRDLTVSDTIVPLEYLSGGYLVYKEGQSALWFIAETYGPEKISEMVTTVARTHSLERALMEATGFTTPELSAEWERWLKRRYWPEVSGRNRGQDVLKLITNHAKDDSYLNLGPSVSPDGQRVAYVTDRSGYSEIVVSSMLDGELLSKPVRGERSDDFETLHLLRPGVSWSPDGTRLCIAAKSGARDAIHIVDAETGRRTATLRFPLDGVFTPAWSPDGERIAFIGTLAGGSDLYVVDADGRNVKRLTSDFFDDRSPVWSPDGTRIAFSSDRDAPVRDDFRRSYDIYAIDVETRRVERLVATVADEHDPAWSPDGTELIYESDADGSPQLYAADLITGESVRLTNLIGGARSPSWATAGGSDRMAACVYGEVGWDIAAVKEPLVAFSDAIESGERTPSVDQAYLTGEVVDGPWMGVAIAERVKLAPRPEAPGAERARGGQESEGEPEHVASTEGGTEDQGATGLSEGSSSESSGTGAGESDTVAKAREAFQAATRGVPGPQEPAAGRVEDEEERRLGTVERYRPRFSPDWVSGGLAYTSGYGFSGTAQIAVSDVLGNHRFYIATDFFSSLESSNFQVIYQRLADRANLSVGVYNFKDYYYSERTFLGEDLGEKRYFSERSYGISAGLSYPFSMFTRVELDLSALSVDRRFAEENPEGYIELTDEKVTRSLIIPSVRLVNDTTLWGSVGPISGGRSSISVQRAWESGGDFGYLTGIADIRRYLRIGSRHSLAVKLVAARSSARNAQNFYMGGVNSLRGYDDFEFHGRNLALASVEFRYPFIDHLDIASPIPLSLWGLRGVMFVDAGAAWDNDFRGVTSAGGVRRLEDIKASTGVGVRLRLSMFVIRVDWAWPTDMHTTGAPMTHFALGAEF